ncbi:hypothetical protein ACQWHJ_25095, partial [Salmonella enterica subsp. enterica serovar Infantis]
FRFVSLGAGSFLFTFVVFGVVGCCLVFSDFLFNFIINQNKKPNPTHPPPKTNVTIKNPENNPPFKPPKKSAPQPPPHPKKTHGIL